jgi:hypothetical protein
MANGWADNLGQVVSLLAPTRGKHDFLLGDFVSGKTTRLRASNGLETLERRMMMAVDFALTDGGLVVNGTNSADVKGNAGDLISLT